MDVISSKYYFADELVTKNYITIFSLQILQSESLCETVAYYVYFDYWDKKFAYGHVDKVSSVVVVCWQ